MSVRTVPVQFPGTWTDEEVAERLRRLREPEVSAEQREKVSARVTVESRTLATAVATLDHVGQRVDVIEARLVQVAGLEDVAEAMADITQLRGQLEILASSIEDERAKRELAEKRMDAELARIEREAKALTEDRFRSLRGSLGQLAKRLARQVSGDKA